jgi:hypothetical protein
MIRFEAPIARAVILSMTELPISLPLTTFPGIMTAFVRPDSMAVDNMAAPGNCRERPDVKKEKEG